MTKFLITGSSGQLGLTLQEHSILGRDWVMDHKSTYNLDITDQINIENHFRRNQYSCCINLAAYTNVEQAEKTPEPAYEVNAEGVKNLAIACKKHGTKLIHISTDYVFDGEKKGPYTVDDPTNPINEYGKSKLLGEEYIRELLDEHYIVRTSWLYSKKYGNNFYRTIVKKAKEGQELRITDQQLGCPTNTETVAKFIIEELIQGNKPYGTYHVTDGVPMTWFDFAKRILEENGLTEKAKLVLDRNYRTFAKRPRNSVLA